MIFYHSPEQKAAAEELMAEFERQGTWEDPIVTELRPAEAFFPAEPYHQDFYAKNPGQFYCQAVVAPKVAKVRKEFMSKLLR